jgi:5-methylcytosine-specific restriction endonuclease McrA
MSKQKAKLKQHYLYRQQNIKNKIKGNKSNKKNKRSKYNEYDDLYYWSREVRMADNYRCVYCGTSRRLSAHHIFHKSKYPGLMFNLNNGILLCIKCHVNIHKLNDLN